MASQEKRTLRRRFKKIYLYIMYIFVALYFFIVFLQPCDVMDFSIDKETRDDSNRDDSNHGDSIRSVPNREDSNPNCLSNMEAETAVDASSDSNSAASSTSSRSSQSELHPNESVYFTPTTP